MNRTAFLTATISALCLSTVCRAEGISTLVEASKDMSEARRELERDTERFDHVKSDIEKGDLHKGISRQDVLSRYGEPVVINEDFVSKRERWVYKPDASSFFKGTKISILFDANGILDEIVLYGILTNDER